LGGRVIGAAVREAPPTGRVQLANGQLEVAVHRADQPLESLCAFAARRNRRRGHLIVSRVLGRHLACRPSAMRAASNALSAKLPTDLPGPVLIVGLAETAVCLGQSLHEVYRARRGREDVVFLHSTRQQLDAPLLARFDEAHSHAPAHLLHHGRSPEVRDAIEAARSLVLVDDEASTGATFVQLAGVLQARLRKLRTLHTAVLTDWSDGSWRARVGMPGRSHSLLDGTLRFVPDSDQAHEAAPAAAAGFGVAPTDVNFGRQGRLDVATEVDAMAERVRWRPGRPLLVVGSGEFTYPPFRVAERLEQAGADVWMQSLSRSPIQLGGPIRSVLHAADDYGSGAPMQLYNAADWPGDVVVCHETPSGSVDPSLVKALDAQVLTFGAPA
jgi:hypothetical protein